MNRPELYNKTVQILVDAYFNDTLEHNNCYACAVGNMVAACLNIDFRLASNGRMAWDTFSIVSYWDNVFITVDGQQFTNPHLYFGEAKRQIDSTGYSFDDLAKIEFAFESAPRGASGEDYMFNGLMAVIEVLDEIHENKDQSVTDTSKKRFHKQTV